MTPEYDSLWSGAQIAFLKLGMARSDPKNGALVEIVDWCNRVKSRPFGRRLRFLELESPALLAYLEALDADGSAQAWLSLSERINQAVEQVDKKTHPFSWPWQLAIWSIIPDLAAIGRAILRRQAKASNCKLQMTSLRLEEQEGGAGGEGSGKGSGDKAGSAGAAATRSYAPAPRLRLPVVPVELSDIERKIFDLIDDTNSDDDAERSVSADLDVADDECSPLTPMGGPR